MTEVAIDPAVSEGQTTEGTNEGSTEPINEMGLGMLDLDQPRSDPEEQSAGQTNAEEVEVEESASTRNSTNDDLSPLERDRREADRYFTQLKQQHDQYVAQETAKLKQLQEQQAQPQTVQQQTMQDAESLRRAAMQATDAEQQRSLMEQAAGIDYVHNLISQEIQQALQKNGLDQVGQLRQVVEQLQGQNQAQMQQRMQKQIAEVVEVFGQDIGKDASTLRFIERNRDALNEVNPKTGENWTLAELVGQWTGRTAEEAREARETQRTQRRNAKSGAATRGQSTGARNTQSSGVISKSTALDEIRQTYE